MIDRNELYRLNRRATRKSQVLGRKPLELTAEMIDAARTAISANSTPPWYLPFIGYRRPRGWRLVGEPLFCDTTGLDNHGPALSHQRFLEALVPGAAYGVAESGQFQAYVQRFERIGAKAAPCV